MAYEFEPPRLFDGDKRGRSLPPGPKSFLFLLNLQVDWLLERIEAIRWDFSSIMWEDDDSELERLTLALEDRWFFEHSGIDLRAVPRVIRQIVSLKRVGGVSTIEQQLVRTLLERRERTLKRKSREMMLAWIISHRMAKRDILRAYLATAYFGYRLRGCDQVSDFVFGKPASDLESEEAAFVASLLVYPLPKVVREFGEASALYPVGDLRSFLKAASPIAPRWGRRVHRRLNYGLARVRKAK